MSERMMFGLAAIIAGAALIGGAVILVIGNTHDPLVLGLVGAVSIIVGVSIVQREAS